jgi:predicted nucleic acid-binding protein
VIVAILDANVLYSAVLRDLLMWLAINKTFSAHWTNQIQQEWVQNLLTNRNDIQPSTLERTQYLMNRALPNALLENIPEIDIALPDPKDLHVIAGAIHINATHIVTNNLRHFPTEILELHDINALNPNDFVMHLTQTNPELVIKAVQMQHANLKHPSLSLEQFLNQLEAHGLAPFTTWLRETNF